MRQWRPLALYAQLWRLGGVSDADGFAALAAVVILGTICAFSFYMTGLKIIECNSCGGDSGDERR